MSYKDKDKQRQAVRESTRHYRLRVSQVSQDKAEVVIPSRGSSVIPDGSTTIVPVQVVHCAVEVVAQSHNPMMVGYVPPRQA